MFTNQELITIQHHTKEHCTEHQSQTSQNTDRPPVVTQIWDLKLQRRWSQDKTDHTIDQKIIEIDVTNSLLDIVNIDAKEWITMQ